MARTQNPSNPPPLLPDFPPDLPPDLLPDLLPPINPESDPPDLSPEVFFVPPDESDLRSNRNERFVVSPPTTSTDFTHAL